jgi:hypothetical protein
METLLDWVGAEAPLVVLGGLRQPVSFLSRLPTMTGGRSAARTVRGLDRLSPTPFIQAGKAFASATVVIAPPVPRGAKREKRYVSTAYKKTASGEHAGCLGKTHDPEDTVYQFMTL